jgi:signal transduction histidine kinase
MKIKDLSSKPLLKDLLLMFLFGALTYLFGLVKFSIPGLDGAISDLRELPLLVSIFHLSNPLFTIGISAISALGTPPEGSYLASITMHSIPLIISWILFNYLKKQKYPTLLLALFTFLYIFIYYLAFIFPILIIVNHLVGINLETSFSVFYVEMVQASKFEMISTALVIPSYLVQHNYRLALKKHMSVLEETVAERTADLNTVINKLKNTQQYLIQSEKMASLGTLSAGVAHEINNPLNFISGGSHLISEIKEEIENTASDELIDKYDKATILINEGITRTTNIVKALMNFSLYDKSKLREADIHEIIENTLLFLNYKIPEDITIKKDFQLKSNVPLYIDKIHQVIINIIENAIFELKSVSSKKKVITIFTSQNKNNSIVEISNNGNQIPEQNLNQVFDPFFTTKDPGQGIGLGLSICYSIITEHKGKISAKNSNSGVSIIIELPLK